MLLDLSRRAATPTSCTGGLRARNGRGAIVGRLKTDEWSYRKGMVVQRDGDRVMPQMRGRSPRLQAALRVLAGALLAIAACVPAAGACFRIPPGPRIPMAVTLKTVPVPTQFTWQCAFMLDHQRSQVLFWTIGDPTGWWPDHLYWLRGGALALTHLGGVKQDQLLVADPYAVDFRHGWAYMEDIADSIELGRIRLEGRRLEQLTGSHQPQFVIPRSRGDTVEVVSFTSNGMPTVEKSWLFTYVDGKKSDATPMKSLPDGAIYAARADRLFFVYGNRVEEWPEGASFVLPRPALAIDIIPYYCPVDVTPDAAFVYYADPQSRIISKIRVSTGRIVARRRLDFTPVALAVQRSKSRLLVAGEAPLGHSTGIDAVHVIKGF